MTVKNISKQTTLFSSKFTLREKLLTTLKQWPLLGPGPDFGYGWFRGGFPLNNHFVEALPLWALWGLETIKYCSGCGISRTHQHVSLSIWEESGLLCWHTDGKHQFQTVLLSFRRTMMSPLMQVVKDKSYFIFQASSPFLLALFHSQRRSLTAFGEPSPCLSQISGNAHTTEMKRALLWLWWSGLHQQGNLKYFKTTCIFLKTSDIDC